jgi:Zn-finger nucleic acid-binding protein
MSDRHGVEIDYCPQCRGVWLDRGELDKVIDRTAAHNATYERSRTERSADRPQDRPRDQDRRDRDDYERSQQRPRKRESFLSELFDF